MLWLSKWTGVTSKQQLTLLIIPVAAFVIRAGCAATFRGKNDLEISDQHVYQPLVTDPRFRVPTIPLFGLFAAVTMEKFREKTIMFV